MVLTLLFVLLFQVPVIEWKSIKEMSGEIPDNPGLTILTSASQIARDGDNVKVAFRFEFPGGAPWSVFRESVPSGFDVSSISKIEGRLELDCVTRTIRAKGNSAYIYQFNGKRFKSKEPPFRVEEGNILAAYFCETGTKPTVAPKLKPK